MSWTCPTILVNKDLRRLIGNVRCLSGTTFTLCCMRCIFTALRAKSVAGLTSSQLRVSWDLLIGFNFSTRFLSSSPAGVLFPLLQLHLRHHHHHHPFEHHLLSVLHHSLCAGCLCSALELRRWLAVDDCILTASVFCLIKDFL